MPRASRCLRRKPRAATCNLFFSRAHMHMHRGKTYGRTPGCQAAGPRVPWKYRISWWRGSVWIVHKLAYSTDQRQDNVRCVCLEVDKKWSLIRWTESRSKPVVLSPAPQLRHQPLCRKRPVSTTQTPSTLLVRPTSQQLSYYYKCADWPLLIAMLGTGERRRSGQRRSGADVCAL
jgi:hypothetical protein